VQRCLAGYLEPEEAWRLSCRRARALFGPAA
jgi:hypothetical protein